MRFINSLFNQLKWSPTGKARGTSITYPPTPMGAEKLRRKCQGFGGLSASSGIRRSINPGAQERFSHGVRIHPRAEPAVFCVGG
jgi:hypothetical protein